MKRLTRREFLKRLSLGAAGAYVALNAPKSDAQMMGSGTGGGGMGGGASVIDPPPGAAFADPPEMGNFSTVPGIVEVDLEARPAWVNVMPVLRSLEPAPSTFKANIKHKLSNRLRELTSGGGREVGGGIVRE